MPQTKVIKLNQEARKRPGINRPTHLTLAALFIVSQIGFTHALNNRSHTLVYATIAVTLGSLINVYQYTKRVDGSPSLSSLVYPAIVQSVPFNIILYAVAHFKEHINDFLVTRQALHSRTTVVSTAFLYAVTTLALILSAYVHTGLSPWTVASLELAAFLSLIGHIVVTTSDTEGLIDILTMSTAALATFSTKLYWSQSFEVFHPRGAHGDGPIDASLD